MPIRRFLSPALVTVAVLLAGCSVADPSAEGQPSPMSSRPAPSSPTPSTPPSSSQGSASTSPSSPGASSPTSGAAGSAQADRALLRAVRAGDLAAVRAAIADGADLEVRGGDARRTPLIIATRANEIEIARTLLAAGADPDAKDAIKDSAFLYAGAEGLDEILRATLEYGANVRSTNRFGGTALIPAGEHAHLSTMRILIDAGVPVDHVNNLGWTALHETIVLGDGSERHVRAARMLLEAGADPELPDGDGTSPRRLAADHGFRDLVRVIDEYR